MEDRFKLRFWHNEYKKMVEVFNFGIDGGCCEWVQHSPIYNTEDGLPVLDNWGGVMEEQSKIIRRSKLVDGILEQCTGLRDIHNKLIFENDIVSTFRNTTNNESGIEEYKCIIRWIDNGFQIPHYYNKATQSIVSKMDIVGNMHENPELDKIANIAHYWKER